MKKPRKSSRELADRLHAAALSHFTGRSFETSLQKVKAEQKPKGSLWPWIAEMIEGIK